MRWVLEQYRSQGARALVNQARVAAAQLLTPQQAPTASRSAATDPRGHREDWPQDVLAGICAGVALRDLNLVDSLLAQLEGMEAKEGDPDALARLYRLDHLAARLRRNAENLRVLAGHDVGSTASAASPLVDVIRAAMSSIEQYSRIEIGRVAALAVVDFAADDLSRLLAELLDNAAAHSPPTCNVTVSAHLTEQGSVLLRIEDSGIGLPADRLRVLNERLCATPRLDNESIEHMGLPVVRRLAGKHAVRVRLDKRATHGTVASVLLPATLVCEVPPTPWFADTPTTTIPRVPLAPNRSLVGPPPLPRSSPESTEPTGTPAAPTTTKSGLPRRVSQSLRDYAVYFSIASDSPVDPDSDPGKGREQLLNDLGDFSAGEQAARDVRDEQAPPPETELKDDPHDH